MGGHRQAVLAVAFALAVPQAAHAQPTMESAKAALAASDYPGARQQLAAVLALGKHGPADVAEIYKMIGIAAAAVGESGAATQAFAQCLALAPKTTLPDGTSPKITKPFASAQAMITTPLAIKAEARNDPPAVVIHLQADPVGMLAKYRVTVRVDGEVKPPVEKPAAEEMEIAVPVGARVDVWVAGIDRHGNRLVEVGSSDVPLVIIGKGTGAPPPDDGKKKVVTTTPPPASGPSTPPSERPIYLQWWLWGGATLVAAGVTSYFGMQALDGRDSLQAMTMANPNWDTFRATQDRTQRDVLITNIGLGVTGVFGIAATILFLTRPDTTVAPMAVERGGGVAMRGRF